MSPDAVVHVALAAAVPARGGPSFELEPKTGHGTPTPAAGEAVYVWTDKGTARLAMDEAG